MRIVQNALAAFNRITFRICQAITALLLATLVVTNLAEVAARGFWSYSIEWVFEVNTLMAVWLYFLGIYLVYFRRDDISVKILVRRLPAGVQRYLEVLVDVAIVGTCFTIGWQAVHLIGVQWPLKTPGLRLPNPLFTAPVLLGSALMCATMTERLLGRLTGAPSDPPSDPHAQES